MADNTVFFFSGTGNSLRSALGIAQKLKNCDVVSMGPSNDYRPTQSLKSVGFVFPCYFSGVPQRVLGFIATLDTALYQSAYCYGIVTYGGAGAAATLGQLSTALAQKQLKLHYGAKLKSFANYVVGYDMSDKVAEKTAASKATLVTLIDDITSRHQCVTPGTHSLFLGYNRFMSRDIANKDRNFAVNDACVSCGRCAQVCPVNNIVSKGDNGHVDDGHTDRGCVDNGHVGKGHPNSGSPVRPRWQHHCEQCLACLHWCPQRAINYGTKTAERGRYTNPEITAQSFIQHTHNQLPEAPSA
ncbi:MAG: EFR1 family ferrodoxin [Coriobacteriales bacterium]|jgi:ferredoxin|nr:EFR1 family ferrodoxin [Coriobacteriales bacterium]